MIVILHERRKLMGDKVIEVKDLVKEYKQLRAVDGISFDVYEKEIFGLLGPNGSGKSTTINSVLSLLKYSSGSIKLFGREMTPDAYDLKRDTGVIFQDVAVFSELTVYENIDYFCGLYITGKKERKKCVEDAMELVGIGDFRKFYPKQLSGGLLRRLNIACGIAHKPKLIFLDEPTVAVDPQSRNNILEGIMKLRDNGATVVYTTHYMEEVEQICDRIVIMDKGKIIASGTCDELKKLAGTEEKITVGLKNTDKDPTDGIRKLLHVTDVFKEDSIITVSYDGGTHNIARLIDHLREQGVSYSTINSQRPTLNDVFLELTGKELRD